MTLREFNMRMSMGEFRFPLRLSINSQPEVTVLGIKDGRAIIETETGRGSIGLPASGTFEVRQ